MKTKVYNQQGQEIKEIDLPDNIFGLKINHDLIHQAYLAQRANSRSAIANTKTRKEVRGGGRKPWKQKGTGRARHGSIRSPLWRGGGVVFGPTNERNYSQKINKRMNRQAILMALSSKAESGEVLVLDSLVLNEIKTKKAFNILKALPIKGKTLIAQPDKDKIAQKSFRNVPGAKTILANSLNVLDLMDNRNLIITENGINTVKNTFLKQI